MSQPVNRREFVKHATAAGLLGAGLLNASSHAAAGRKPNVIVILTDDMGTADVGFNGCKDIPTPNIDKVAQGGVRFQCGYVSHPFCSPTRAGLMTGRYQQRFGHENNPKYDPKDEKSGLPLDQITLPQVLKQAGYVTGIVGKWHLGATPEFHPLRRGFDEQFGFIGGGHQYFEAGPAGDTREYFIPIERNGKPVEEKEYLTDAFSREAAAFVRRHRNEPFFLYLAYNAPHTPQQVSDKYLSRFSQIIDPKRRNYAAMLSAVDDGVGLLLSTLSEMKLDSDTLIFFLSDNGGPVGVNGSNNDPFRGAKGQVYEGGVRVAFAARWTGHLPAGKIYDQPVISLDILSTAAALAGAPLPKDRVMDGVNLIPCLTGENKKPPHEMLFWRTGGGASGAVRAGRWKLVKMANAAPALYDLETDISESKDVAAAEPQRVEQLLKAHNEWNAQLVPPKFESPQPAKKQAKAKAKAKGKVK